MTIFTAPPIIAATITATVIAAGLYATTVVAQPVSNSLRVSYADLNLSASAGQTTLTRRIDTAAKIVCDATGGPHDLTIIASERRCYKAAVSGARTAIASAMAADRTLASR